MQRLLEATPIESPRAIGVDEISIKKRHQYRIVVSDLERRRPIWFGGKDRSEDSFAEFFVWLNQHTEQGAAGIEVAVMDMWKPFAKGLKRHAPQAAIVYDKFHVMRHLGDALDRVRKDEYRRASETDRRFIKGQKYTLLSAPAHLTPAGRNSLTVLLKANERIHRAYLLKETFGQLWGFRRPGWARRFFERWKEQLRWQRLPSFQRFAAMIERHWDGIEAYSRPENKVSLGLVEGINNKIRVIQRRAYGLRDEQYLRLKVLTAFLHPQKPSLATH
jgi:transposase